MIMPVGENYKTPVIQRTLNPQWQYKTNIAKVGFHHILVMELYDKDKIGKDDPLGAASLPLVSDLIPIANLSLMDSLPLCVVAIGAQ